MKKLEFVVGTIVASVISASSALAEPSPPEACLYFANEHIFANLDLQDSYDSYKNFDIPPVVKLSDSLDRYATYVWQDIFFEAYGRASGSTPSVIGKVTLVCHVDYVQRRVLNVVGQPGEKEYDKYETSNGDKIRVERVKPLAVETGALVHEGRF